jgi:peroxiredoxin Q/BCP
MSHRLEEKQARRAQRERAEQAALRAQARQRFARRAGYGTVAAIAATLIALSALLGGGSNPPAPATPTGAGTGADVGAKAPDFALTDVVSGKQVTAASLRGSETMLFFSEGVNCQACMVQAADLEKAGTLDKEGIRLVSVTTDQPGDLAQAARQYGITTPLLADPTTAMSSAYGMLGHGGMGHPDTNGHAFMLLDEQGTVRWHRAYQEMYVEPAKLLRDMTAEAKA